MIEVENLTRFYGPTAAIQDVSFRVDQGQIVGFLGPNGAGKTTTLRILSGYLPATSGTARVAGFDVFKESLAVRRRLGYLPENVPLYPEMRVRTYLDFVAEVKGVPRQERQRRVAAAMERCRVDDVANHLIGSLSRGYRQRVGIAQAILHDPEVILLDEPTVGLDPKQIIEIRQLITELAGQRTVILSTHILPEVEMVCQRVIIINQGKIVAVDTPENLKAKIRTSARVLLQVDGPAVAVRDHLERVPGVLRVEERPERADGRIRYLVECAPDRDLRRDLAAVVVRQGWGLSELRPADVMLEEVFIRLVTDESAHEQPAGQEGEP
ncbi:MAG: ABC transporter ATP-binding protein [candidate division NC10 bacterium]|nr:ABC transporter ATP-binding protein [candidate division NC10 bacterium]